MYAAANQPFLEFRRLKLNFGYSIRVLDNPLNPAYCVFSQPINTYYETHQTCVLSLGVSTLPHQRLVIHFDHRLPQRNHPVRP